MTEDALKAALAGSSMLAPTPAPAATDDLAADLAAQLAGTRVITQPGMGAPPSSLPRNLSNLDVSIIPSRSESDGTPTAAATGDIQQLLIDLSAALNTAQISDVLHSVIRYIDADPATADLLRPDDIGLIVEACRQSFTKTVNSKTARQTTRTEKAARRNRMGAALAGLGI